MIKIKDHPNQGNGKLNSNAKYGETQAYLKVLNEAMDLHGIVCDNSLWKDNKCH